MRMGIIMNRSNFISEYFMRKKGNTKNRPEQMLVFDILGFHCKYEQIETEYKVRYKTEWNDYRDAILDIFLKANGISYAIRVMGKSHPRSKKTMKGRKDSLQKDYLQRDDYHVIDIWHDTCPMVFLRNERKLTDVELLIAFGELQANIPYLLPDIPSKEWLEKTEHKK